MKKILFQTEDKQKKQEMMIKSLNSELNEMKVENELLKLDILNNKLHINMLETYSKKRNKR